MEVESVLLHSHSLLSLARISSLNLLDVPTTLKEKGILTNPIPLVDVNTYKFDAEGKIDKYKHRKPLAGHPGNMQKGVHYDKSFAPTPTQHSSRLLMAVMIKFGLYILTFDVSQAYVQAILPENEQIAVRYPDGFKRFHPQTGEELFAMICSGLRSTTMTGPHNTRGFIACWGLLAIDKI